MRKAAQAWPGSLNKRRVLKFPAWDLGLAPLPPDLGSPPDELMRWQDAVREWGHKVGAALAERDQIIAAKHERLLPLLIEHLGAEPDDYKAAFLLLAKRCVPAFKEPGDRGRRPEFREKLKLLANVDRVKQKYGLKTDKEALERIFKDAPDVDIASKGKRLSEARRWRKELRSPQKSFPGK
jgi:hypothetical protein